MPDPRFRSKRRLGTHVLLVMGLAVALLSLGTVSGFAADKAVETAGSLGSYHWQPSSAEVAPAGTVEFKNSESVPHGVVFEDPPAAPSCPGVPSIGTTGTWSGTCTFAQAGAYKFYCPVHPIEMKGTVTVSGPAAPVVTAEPATAVTETEATLNGRVNPSGQATTYFFKYGTTLAYGQESAHLSAGSGSVAVAKFATVNGLTAATTYHFQLVAENASGTVVSADRTFATAGPPAATTDPASGIGSIAATLRGTVNPRGLSTEYFFNFGTTTAYGQETAKQVAGPGVSNVAASQAINGLLPETTYHFQLVAKNSAGEEKGADRSFTTSGAQLAPTDQAPAVSSAPPAATPAAATATSAPETKITLRPPARTRDRTPTIKFNAPGGGASYLCSVDGKPFKACRSPFTAPVLKPGTHTIRVKAVVAGLADPTPASSSFRVLTPK